MSLISVCSTHMFNKNTTKPFFKRSYDNKWIEYMSVQYDIWLWSQYAYAYAVCRISIIIYLQIRHASNAMIGKYQEGDIGACLSLILGLQDDSNQCN